MTSAITGCTPRGYSSGGFFDPDASTTGPEAAVADAIVPTDLGLSLPTEPPAQCLTGHNCVEDRDCPSGARCNRSLVPSRCQRVFCGAEGSRCLEDSMCPTELRCWIGACRRCNGCGPLCIVDFQRDTQHCGRCNSPAPVGGACVNGAGVCPDGRTNCGGRCVDLTTDPQNCGACGVSVSINARCVNGADTCNPGLTPCGGGCVDTRSDVRHCGACDTPVARPQVCRDGRPGCVTSTQVVCGNACVDTATSRENCGACGNACPTGATCSAGRCNTSLTTQMRISCAEACGATGATCVEGRSSVVCGSGFLPGSIAVACATTPPSSCNSSGAGPQPFHSISCVCRL